jgi:hypothetical protein
VEFPVVAKARIVNEKIDLDFFGGEPVGEGVAAVSIGEIGRKNPHIEVRVESAKVGGEFLEAIIAPGDENEARGQRGELAREFGSEPSGGSSNERGATLEESQHNAVKGLRPRSEKGFR